MAEDKEKARLTTSAPSLLSPSSAARGEAGAPRILAALEGRAPDAEVKHLPNKRRARPVRWVVLALLLALFAGAATWLVIEDQAAPQMAQAPASDQETPAAGPTANQVASATNPDLIAKAATSPAADPAPAPATAAIIDETPPAADPNLGRGEREPEGEPTNPLSVLAMSAPAPGVPTPGVPTPGASAPVAAGKPAAPGPTRQAAEQQRKQGDNAARQARPPKAAPRKPADTDAALLSALMDYGLPPASPPGTRVYKSDGMFMRVMPGSPLADRLGECRKLSFLEGEQCRLRTCAGHWGTAPECPTPQATIEP